MEIVLEVYAEENGEGFLLSFLVADPKQGSESIDLSQHTMGLYSDDPIVNGKYLKSTIHLTNLTCIIA